MTNPADEPVMEVSHRHDPATGNIEYMLTPKCTCVMLERPTAASLATCPAHRNLAADPPVAPEGRDGALPTSDTIEEVLREDSVSAQWLSGYETGRLDQHAATRTALLAELAQSAGEEIRSILRAAITGEPGEFVLSQPNGQHFTRWGLVERRILAHVAALAKERDTLASKLTTALDCLGHQELYQARIEALAAERDEAAKEWAALHNAYRFDMAASRAAALEEGFAQGIEAAAKLLERLRIEECSKVVGEKFCDAVGCDSHGIHCEEAMIMYLRSTERKAGMCEWTLQSAENEIYRTSCGAVFDLDQMGFSESAKYNHCPHCGAGIAEPSRALVPGPGATDGRGRDALCPKCNGTGWVRSDDPDFDLQHCDCGALPT